jgi:penicillin-binding protein 1A
VPDGVAWEVTQILEENVRYGTGTRARLGDRAVAGKTGTTDDHADAWFVGYTPGVSTAVWMGFTRGEIPMENVHGISVSGGSFPAEIWRRFMEPALSDSPPRDFPDEPRQPLQWEPFERGPWALSYDPYAKTETTETTETTEKTAEPGNESTTDTTPARPGAAP